MPAVCVGPVIQITNAYPHVVMKMIRHSDGETDAEDSVRNSQHVEVPILEIKPAGAYAPDQSHRRK